MPLGQVVKRAYRDRWQNAPMSTSGASKGGANAKEIGSRFRVARKQLGLTQEQLETKLSIDQTAISRFEQGGRGLETESLLALLAFMADRGVSLRYILLGGDDEKVMQTRSESEVLERLGSIEKKLETIQETGEHLIPRAATKRR